VTAKSVLMRPPALRPGARALTCPSPCYATVSNEGHLQNRMVKPAIIPQLNIYTMWTVSRKV